jgi:hypothetical protein
MLPAAIATPKRYQARGFVQVSYSRRGRGTATGSSGAGRTHADSEPNLLCDIESDVIATSVVGSANELRVGVAIRRAVTPESSQKGPLPVNKRAGTVHCQRKRRVTGIQPVRKIAADQQTQTNLAWALAEAVKPHLSIVERHHVYMAIGVGEMFMAIHWLITSAATNQILLPGELVQRCGTWLDSYGGHSQQQHLRGLVEYVLAPLCVPESFASYGDRAPK